MRVELGAEPRAGANFNSKIAQLVEHSAVDHKVLFNRECKSHKVKVNRNVVGSSPTSGAIFWEYRIAAIARRCKRLGSRLRRFESYCSHQFNLCVVQ